MPPSSPAADFDGPFRVSALGDCALLREALEKAEYRENRVSEVTDLARPGMPIDQKLTLLQTDDGTPFSGMVRLFVLGIPLSIAEARRVLAPADVQPLIDAGVLIVSGDSVIAAAQLLPFENWWMLCDFAAATSRPGTSADQVSGVGLASMLLTQLVPRRPFDRAFDLGTGGGVQALAASPHVRRITASDLNPRALNFAACTAQINGVHSIDFVEGSLFDPVAGEKFDLIISNPPFAISPSMKFVYRDGHLPGDGFSEQVVRQAAAHLNEDGFGVVIFDWRHDSVDDWAERPKQWLSDSGCDGWLVQLQSQTPTAYAGDWSSSLLLVDEAAYARQLDEWLAHYAEIGARRFSRGGLIFRKRTTSAGNWFHSETQDLNHHAGSCGGQIQRIFAAYDLLHGLSDPSELLGVRLKLAPGHVLHQSLEQADGQWVVLRATLRHSQGMEFVGNLDRVAMQLLSLCDGRRTLGEAASSLASTLGVPSDRVSSSVVGMVRALMQKGFFEVAT